MKTIKLAKPWRHRVDDVTVHEYPAGWSGEVTNEMAERAAADGVVVGKPAEVGEVKAVKPASKPKPARTRPAPPPAPADTATPPESATDA